MWQPLLSRVHWQQTLTVRWLCADCALTVASACKPRLLHQQQQQRRGYLAGLHEVPNGIYIKAPVCAAIRCQRQGT